MPCREDEAIKYMMDKYGCTDPRLLGEDNNAESHHHHKSHHKSHDKGHSKKHRTPSGPRSSHQHKPGQVAGGQQSRPAQAPAYQKYQHQIGQPATTSPADGAVLQGLLRRQSTPDLEGNAQNVRTWMAGHGAPETGMPTNQSAVFPDGAASNLGVALNQGMVSPPVMRPPQGPYGEQRQRRHHRRPESGWGPQPFAAMPPPEESAPALNVPPDPITSSHHAAPDGQQRHRRRHHHRTSREPELGPEPVQDSYPGSTMPPVPLMPAGMAPPVGMTVPPEMASPQAPPDGQHHQTHRHRHRRGPNGHSSQEQFALPPAANPPPQSMCEGMSVMAEEAIPMHPAQNIAAARGMSMAPQAPGTSVSLGFPVPPTQNIALRPAAQVASGAPGPGEMWPPTVAMPQAGGMVAAMGGSHRPPPPPPPPAPRTQLLPMGGPQAGGAPPGPQAMAMRMAPGELSRPPTMPLDPRMQPPPTSMPSFPGTGPGSPVSSGSSVSPPPPAPMPPMYLGALS